MNKVSIKIMIFLLLFFVSLSYSQRTINYDIYRAINIKNKEVIKGLLSTSNVDTLKKYYYAFPIKDPIVSIVFSVQCLEQKEDSVIEVELLQTIPKNYLEVSYTSFMMQKPFGIPNIDKQINNIYSEYQSILSRYVLIIPSFLQDYFRYCAMLDGYLADDASRYLYKIALSNGELFFKCLSKSHQEVQEKIYSLLHYEDTNYKNKLLIKYKLFIPISILKKYHIK